MENQRGRSRKRKISPAKKAMNIFKRTVVAVLCFAMVAEYVPGSLVYAAEGTQVIESTGYSDDETITFDEVIEGTTEEGVVSDDDTGAGTGDEANNESDPDAEGGSEEGTGEVTSTGEDEETPDLDEAADSEDDADDENTESDDEKDEESEEGAESEDEEDAGEDADEEPEEDAEAEDGEAEEAEDEELVGEEEAVAGAGAAVVPSTSSVTSYKTVSATIYTDDTYEEKLSDGATIELSGKMPKGAEVKAYPVEVEIEEGAVLAAYDITIFDEDGEEYEPDEDDVIEVTIENDEIREALEEERELTIFHMEDEDDEPEEIAKLPPKTKKPKFSARHFSIYIVVDENLYELDGETPHYVYILNFYLGDVIDEDYDDDDHYVLLSTQTVSPGEKVEEPAVPDWEDYEFAGWYSDPNGGGDEYTEYVSKNSMPEITDNQDHKIELYAHYTGVFYVHYMVMIDENTSAVFYTEQYSLDGALDTTDAEQRYLAEGHLNSYKDENTGATVTTQAVTGWTDDKDDLHASGEKISDLITAGFDKLELYPVVKDAYWLYFDMNKHNSFEDPAPVYILANATYIGNVLPTPEVSGYSFDGWYTESENGIEVTSETSLEDLLEKLGITTDDIHSITLYAHWTESTVAYTINIWRQKATDGAAGINNKAIGTNEEYSDYIAYYDYAESHYVSASDSKLLIGQHLTESSISYIDNWDTYTGYETITDTSSPYYGFEYTDKTAETRTLNDLSSITMAEDGSTVINIFYNRVTITWTFEEDTTGQGGPTGQGTSTGAETGTLIGLYGTNVEQAAGNVAGTLSGWPNAGETTNNVYRWYTGSGTASTEYAYETEFIILNNSTSVTFLNRIFNPNTYAYYYLEVTNESTQVDTSSDKYKEATQTYGVAYTRTVESTLYVYDRRVAIPVEFPAEAESQYAGYTYVGYNTSNSSTTMSTDNFPTETDSGTLYFLFNNANEYTVTLMSNNKVVGVDGAGAPIEATADHTFDVKYGENLNVEKYAFPNLEDYASDFGPAYYYSFNGWYEDPSATSEFNRDITMPANDLIAYAGWDLTKSFTVTFVTNDDNVAAPAYQTLYPGDKAKDPGDLERNGYTLVGWLDENGKVFNFETVLYSDTELTAIWKANEETGYQIEYNLNLDLAQANGWLKNYTGDTTSRNIEQFLEGTEKYEDLWTIEKAFPYLSESEEGIFDQFVYWSTANDGSGERYYPDQKILIGTEDLIWNEGVTTFYAVWTHEKQSTLVLVHNYPDGYDGGTDDDEITKNNLTAIDLGEYAEENKTGMTYHNMITVGDNTYRFEGWSSNSNLPSDPTDKDVNVKADDVVAVDTLLSADGVNYLYAVWIQVHDIKVTKEIVNNSVNYTVPENQTFTFEWSFIDGEGVKNSNEETIEVGDNGSFIISGVASGESVTITETPAEGFTTSYNGAHIDVEDDGNGTCTFAMDENSQEITVYNTVETTTLSVEKDWDDKGTSVDHSEDSVTVIFTEDGDQIGDSITLNEDNNWSASIEIVEKDGSAYNVEETEAPDNYDPSISGDVEDGFIVTNTLKDKSWTVEKELTNEGSGEDGAFKLGETAEFTITVTNNGALDISEITVTEALEGAVFKDSQDGSYTLNEDKTAVTIENLAQGASVYLYAEYTIQEGDFGKDLVNTVTTTSDGSSEEVEASEPIPTEKPNASLSVEKTADVEEGYVAKLGDEISYTITVTNDGNETILDITVKDEKTGLEEKIESLAPGESKTYTTTYTVTEADIEAGSIVNTATATGTSPEGESEDTEGSGDVTIPTETPDTNDMRGFFDIDEEIVPNEDDSSTWEKDEEVEEKHAIEFEMTTTLPSLTEDDLKGLVEDGFTLVFHNDLDDELKLDSEESTDLHITIGGKTIDSAYYSVDINQSKDEWSISTLSAQAAIDDGCSFHVTVDLSKLYAAELISADDFTGNTQITVFFYADLEGAVEGQKYESTVWYEVYDGEEAIYTSDKDTVTVHVSSTSGSTGSGSGSGSGRSSGSGGSATTVGHVRNVNNGKTGHWVLEGGYLTLPDGSHPSNEYLNVDGEIWAFYTNGYAVAKRHTQYYTEEAIAAAGYIPEVTGKWDTIGWWFEYDDGTYPHDEWALLEYNGITYWYHFDVDGWMDDGWFSEKGDTYYLDPVYDGWRGHMMTGWQLIGGYWYYFSEDPNSLGVMLKDTTTPDGFKVDGNGRYIE